MTDSTILKRRADMARAVYMTLEDANRPEEVTNILMTALSVAIDRENARHIRTRAIQLRALADHFQAHAALRGF